jgi:transcriptional regulator with XRE-family HTH domain
MPLDLESITAKMDSLPCTQEALAHFAKVNYLSQILRGIKVLELNVARKLNETLDDLLRVKRILDPVPIDFRRVEAIDALLARLRSGLPLIPPSALEPPQEPKMSDADCWALIQETLTRDPRLILIERGWTGAELAEKIAAARAQLHQSTAGLAASNIDRAQPNL